MANKEYIQGIEQEFSDFHEKMRGHNDRLDRVMNHYIPGLGDDADAHTPGKFCTVCNLEGTLEDLDKVLNNYFSNKRDKTHKFIQA